jgi:hypothetical protein
MPYSNISLITDKNLLFQQYDFVKVSHDENNYIIGRVVGYDINSGEMIFTPLQVNGSGTFDSWNVSLTGSPGQTGVSGTSGTSGSDLQIFGAGPDRLIRYGPDGETINATPNLTFDGETLTIAPFSYSTGGTPVYRVVYHNDGTAGTAGIVVRGSVPGQTFDGIIENRVPHDYRQVFVVGDNNIAYVDSLGLRINQSLVADNGVYFEDLERDDSIDRFLVWDHSTSGGLFGKVKWRSYSGSLGESGSSGSSGSSGTSGVSGFLKDWETENEIIVSSNEQLTFSGDYVLENSEMLIESTETEIEYSTNKYFKKEGKIFIGGNLLVKDSYIENNGLISVGGEVILTGNSQIEGTGIII